MPKPPKEFCIDSFIYKEYTGTNGYSEPIYKDLVTIERCRIDRGAQYSSSASGKVLLYNALIFCYEGVTVMPNAFTTQSIISFDGIDHVVLKVIPIYEAYSATLYSYELEVV